MTTDGTPLNSAEMFGTAKKINNDLEQLPLHTHGALVNLLTTAFQHRQVGMQREDALQKQRQQEQMLALQERLAERILAPKGGLWRKDEVMFHRRRPEDELTTETRRATVEALFGERGSIG